MLDKDYFIQAVTVLFLIFVCGLIVFLYFSLIAVSYEARAKGVKRGMMGDDAKVICPEIFLFRVAEARGKANLDKSVHDNIDGEEKASISVGMIN